MERYQIDLVAAAQSARERMNRKIEAMCAAEVPGDTHRALEVDATYSNQSYKHILVPVWLLTYRYGRETYHVLVNGFTGAITGNYPKSWIKITLLVLAILIAIALIALFVQG